MFYSAGREKAGRQGTRKFPLKRALVSTLLLLKFSPTLAEEQFNTSFIHGDASSVAALSASDDILPGSYPFDIYVNAERVDHKDVEFRKTDPAKPIQVCIPVKDYLAYGIELQKLSGDPADCFDLPAHLQGASVTYDAAIQKVDISVPQIFMIPTPKGAISSRLYDDGINAAFINYNFSGSKNRTKNSGDSDYLYTSTQNGLNLGRWRLRNNSNWQKQSEGPGKLTSVATWAETDIVPWRSRVQVGQRSTSNAVFDSFQFRGVQLFSVPEILPDSLRGYAPVVRGVARSNARVEIRQNGYTVYSTNVAPGPFELSDIYPSTLSGNLAVTVFEADGSKQNFIVPFSSISNMLRAGIWEYALTAGKYQDGSGNSYQPRFIQGTVSRGMGGDYTPYGGLLVADHYRSAVLGVGKSLGMFGAASFDTAWSDTELASGDRKQGASFRFLYSKSLNAMGTELQIAGYRYSTSGYYDFSDAVTERASYENGQYRNEYDDTTASSDGMPSWANTTKNYYYSDRYNNKRQRVELTVSQHLGPVSLYSTLTNQTYWGSGNRDRTLQVGLNSMYKDVSYGLFVQDSRSNYGQKDRTMNLTLSVPFTVFGQKPVTASLNMAHSKQSGDSYSTGMGGSLLDDNRLNYYLQTGHAENGGQTTMADVGYMGSMGNAQVGYSWNENYSQSSLNLSGGVLAHRGGVTLSQPMQNTIVLVEARDAKGVRLENQPGVAVDRFGYAVMTSATAYRHNRVALNTEDIGAGLDIPLAARDVVPTYGAISRVTFETRTGQSLLLHLKIAEGNYPAIGATVFNDAGANIGTVGTTGTAYVSGVSEHQHLQVKWGEGAGSACEVVLPGFKDLNAAGYQELSLACTPK